MSNKVHRDNKAGVIQNRRNTSLRRISVDVLFEMPDREEMVRVKLKGTYKAWSKLELQGEHELLYGHIEPFFSRTRYAIKQSFRERWEEFADDFYPIIQAAQAINPLCLPKPRKASLYPIGFKSEAKQLYRYLLFWKMLPYESCPIFLRKCFEEYGINQEASAVDATLTILEKRYNLHLIGEGYSETQRSQNFYRKYLMRSNKLKSRLANPSYFLPPRMAELFSPFCPCLRKYFHQDKVSYMTDHPF